jgi:protein-disulfide isomerase
VLADLAPAQQPGCSVASTVDRPPGVGKLRAVARLPKKKAPPVQKRPSGRMVALAFAVAIGAAVALVAAALLLRNDDEARPASPSPTVDLAGIPQDGTRLGADSAKVRLIEYADLQCPFCRDYAEMVFPTLFAEYVRPGRVQAEFRGLAFLGSDSEKALRLVLAAGLQDRLWHMQEALYRNQGAENAGWVTDELVRALGEEIEGLDVDRMFEDADGAEVTALLGESAQQAQAVGVRGTPSFYVQIGEQEPYRLELEALDPSVFRPALDDALGG